MSDHALDRRSSGQSKTRLGGLSSTSVVRTRPSRSSRTSISLARMMPSAMHVVPSFHRYRKRLDGDAAKVLDPDNPLLAKFQEVLKEQLLRQIETLKNDIFENETGAKKKNAAREELGIEAYEFQQIIRSQQVTLEKNVKDLATMTAAREEMEHQLQQKVEMEKKQKEVLAECEKEGIFLRNEIASVHLLINQMTEWENDVESNIAVSKTIAEKTRKDRMRLAEEKRRQDGIIYKLMTEIWRLEGELEHMDMQLRVKETEREELAQTVASTNTNIGALASEHRCLMGSWNTVIHAIANKDRAINCLKDKLKELNDSAQNLLSETDQIKKLTMHEMQENEKMTIIKGGIENDTRICKNQMVDLLNKKDGLEMKLRNGQAIICQLEEDIEKVMNESNQFAAEEKLLTMELDKYNLRKYEVERLILDNLESQVNDNKALVRVCIALEKKKDLNRDMDTAVAESENKNTAVLLEYEQEKAEMELVSVVLKEMEAEMNALEKEADRLGEEITRCDFDVSKKQRVIDHLNTKYGKMVSLEQESSKSPLEVRINALEKNIAETQEKIKDMQRFWLREQRNLVDLTGQRQIQIQDMSLLRKQILILEQKNLQMNDVVEKHRKIEERMQRNVHVMQSKLTNLCDALCKKKGMKNLLDKGNEVVEQEYVSRLKDAELECLKIQADIAEIEDDKLNFSKELVELNREALEWEKKLILVKETKQNMDNEQGKDGEIFTMKTEIHRMKIRLGQLHKAQEKLVQDLEHCIARRDSIFSIAESRGKKSKVGADNTRVIFARKMDDMKNRIRKAECEVDRVEHNIVNLEKKITITDKQIQNIKSEMDDMLEQIKLLDIEAEQAETAKRMNLELLVVKQRKLNMYMEIAKKRTPYTIYRTEAALTTEFTKQKEINTKLCLVLANLLADFPDRQVEFNRMLNTLKIPAFIMYT